VRGRRIVQCVRRLWARLGSANPRVVDSVFAALALVAGLVSLMAEPTPDHPMPTDTVAVILVAVGFGIIALRRRFPIAVLFVVTLATIVYVVRDYPDNGLPVMALIALYTVASLRPRPVWVAAVSLYLVLLLISVVTHPEELSLGDFVGNVAVFGIAAVFGDSVRIRRAYTAALEARAADLERNQEAEAQRAVAEERLRIARELHDVVAHAMSVVAVQSGVGAHIIDTDPAEAKRILENVKVASREALDEMRRLLGVLRQQDDDDERTPAVAGEESGDGSSPATSITGGLRPALAPVPGLDGVESLAQGVRKAGVPVTVTVTGTRAEVPPGVDLCAYRIVQEALTNVLKHAGPARAEVEVGYRPGSVTVVVTDDGRGGSADRSPAIGGMPGSGHGLLGMRERVAVFGGELTTGHRVGGGFRVAATLPFEQAPLSSGRGTGGR
jgi:signal transduction histidine kinase